VQGYLQTTWDTSCLEMAAQYTIVPTWQSKPFHPKNVRHGWTCPTTGWMPPHPTLFLCKEVYEKYGMFNTTFRIAGEYDFMLCAMTDPAMHLRYPPGRNNVRTGLPEVITQMRLGGACPVKFVHKHFTGQAPEA